MLVRAHEGRMLFLSEFALRLCFWKLGAHYSFFPLAHLAPCAWTITVS